MTCGTLKIFDLISKIAIFMISQNFYVHKILNLKMKKLKNAPPLKIKPFAINHVELTQKIALKFLSILYELVIKS